MAGIRRKATTTAAPVEDPQEDTAAAQVTAEDTAPQEGAETQTAPEEGDDTAADWVQQWNVTVAPVPASAADKANVATVVFTIHRLGKGQYQAAYGALTGITHKEPEMTVRSLMKLTSPKRTPLSEYTIDGLKNEPIKPGVLGGNADAPDPWTYEGPTKALLDEAAMQAATGMAELSEGEKSVRHGSVVTGRALCSAWAGMGALTEGGINPPLEQWGKWLDFQTRPAVNGEPAGLLYGTSIKNAANELRFMGSAPDDIVALMPANMNSAKSFQQWTGELVRDAARNAVNILYQAKHVASGDSNEPLAADNAELSKAFHDYIGTVTDRIVTAREKAEAEAQKQNAEHDPQEPQVDAESLLPPAVRTDIMTEAVFKWLARDLPQAESATFNVEFPKHKLGKAIVKAWNIAVKEGTSATVTTTTEGEDKETEKAAPARTFADFSVEEAAQQIVQLLMGRPDDEDRLEILDRVTAILNDKADAAIAAEQARQEAQEAAASEA